MYKAIRNILIFLILSLWIVILLLPKIVGAAPTVCFPQNGCTGTSTIPLAGQVLVGHTNGTYKVVNTSTLGFVATETDPIWSAFLLNPIFTNLTTTNFFATSSVIVNSVTTNATTTRLYVSGTSIFDGLLTFATANGTSITSTNGAFTNLSSTNLTATNITFTNASGTALTSTDAYFSRVNINTTTQLGTVTMQGASGVDPIRIVSSSAAAAQMLALKASGQFVVGANSLSQTGQLSVETPTTNDYALTFTNGVHYTAMLGRQPGTSGQMAIGGLGGTSLNLWAGGISGMIILNTNRFVGINSSTPSTRFVVVGTSTFDGAILQTSFGDCDGATQKVLYDVTTGQFSCGSDNNNDQRVGTSTANYFTFYDTATSVTGTSWVQFANGALTVTTNTNFTIVSSTSGLFGSVTSTDITVTNIYGNPNVTIPSGYLYISSAGGLYVQNTATFRGNVRNDTGVDLTITGGTSGNTNFTGTISVVGTSTLATTTITNLVFTTATGTSLTSTNAFFSNLVVGSTLSLPNNSVTDAMVVPGLTISGGTIDNSPIGNTTPSTGIFTNVTTTNLFATSSVLVSATSTNLFATTLTFTNASGTTLTSTNGIFTNLTFTNATGTVLYLSSALNINNALTVNSVGDVSASGTLRVFGTATFGADTNETFVRNLYRPVNRTTTIADYSSDPDILNRGTGVASTLAVYSDDITRICVQSTAAGASGVVSLKNKNLTPANTNLDSTYNNAGTLQTITAQTLSGGGGAAVVRGCITYQGYHYLMVVNGGVGTIKRMTSTWDGDFANVTSWENATVSGSFDGSMLGLIGAYNGNIYMASNTDDILPYAITTSTNTLTAGTPVNIALNHSLNCTRVNDNGIMTGCDGVPQLQFYDHSGNRLYPFGAGLGASAPATAGPSIFVTRKSNYIVNGSATGLTKLNNILTN